MKKILVCTNYRANPNNPSCAARGSAEIIKTLEIELQQKKWQIKIEPSPCMGFCDVGPNARLAPSGLYFHGITNKNIDKILKEIESFIAY